MSPEQNGEPAQIGPYRVLRRLGVGGMGKVYLGVDADGTQAAIKVIHETLAEQEPFKSRFRQEVDAARSVAGPHIASVLDSDTHARPPWMATEFIDGPNLRERVAGTGPMLSTEVADLADGIAAALQSIHAANLVHRDLTPANVMLSPHGIRVIDFGIARAVDGTRSTQVGQIAGSAGYMSPEQARTGSPGPAGDVFSLGAVLFFAATGIDPFGVGHSADVTYRMVHEQADLATINDPALRSLIGSCLAKSPSHRPSPAQIRDWRQGAPLPARPNEDATPETAVTQIRHKRDQPSAGTEIHKLQHWWIAAGGGAIAVLLVISTLAVVGWAYARRHPPLSPSDPVSGIGGSTTASPTDPAIEPTTPEASSTKQATPKPTRVTKPSNTAQTRVAETTIKPIPQAQASRPTALPPIEWQTAVQGKPPGDMLPNCREGPGSTICFKPDTDTFWVADTRRDGHTAVAEWRLYLRGTGGPLAARGECISPHGGGSWSSCARDVPEAGILLIKARVFDTKTKQFYGTSSTDLAVSAGG